MPLLPMTVNSMLFVVVGHRVIEQSISLALLNLLDCVGVFNGGWRSFSGITCVVETYYVLDWVSYLPLRFSAL
jgi:hypothetical protein